MIIDWSSSRFSRRSTDHTCQSGSRSTIDFANGTMYAAPPEVPGTNTITFFARAEPILMTPTWFRFTL